MALLLLGLLIAVPLIELYLLIQVGQVIGALPTILALVAISVAGALLVRREGWKAWARFRQALDEGRAPTQEVIEGALLVLGGALLLTPGFLTDAVGLLLVVPMTRAGLQRIVRARTSARLGRTRPGGPGTVDVEVVHIERHERPTPGGEVTGGDDVRR